MSSALSAVGRRAERLDELRQLQELGLQQQRVPLAHGQLGGHLAGAQEVQHEHVHVAIAVQEHGALVGHHASAQQPQQGLREAAEAVAAAHVRAAPDVQRHHAARQRVGDPRLHEQPGPLEPFPLLLLQREAPLLQCFRHLGFTNLQSVAE